MKVSEYAVKHPVVVAMLLIVLVVFGLLAITSINVEFMADVSAPSVMVLTVYPGASAEDMERDVTSVLEDDFVTLPDFKSISSESSNSLSLITITFRDGVDPYDRITEVRDRTNKLMESLPEGVTGIPNVFVGGAEMLPVISFAVTGGSDSGTMTQYIEDTLKPRLTSIPGVSSVSVTGGKELQVNIELRTKDLAARNISALTIYQLLNYSNVSLPAGSAVYHNKNISVRYSGEFTSLDDIKNLPVGSTGEGIVIRLQDVADVSLSYPDAEILVTDGESPLILVDIKKRSDGNTMDIAREAKTILADAAKETGGAFEYSIISDDSRIVSASMKTVIMSGVGGIIMAVLIIFLFLNDARATLIIGLSIPLSILFTFVAMKISGVTVNLMSLSGIVVALGMVVDGSIVMIEQVFRYYNRRNPDGTMQYSVQEAIFTGSREVGASIFASTATTVVVFIPIAVLSGLIGMILRDVSLTLIMALSASFVSAVIVVPFLMRLLLHPERQPVRKVSFVNRGMNALERKYRKMLNWSLSSWKFILFISVCVLGATVFIAQSLGIAFVPSTDNSDFYIDVEFPSGYTLEQTEQQMQQINVLLREAVPEVQSAVFYSGQGQSFGAAQSSGNIGYIHVILVPVAERKRDIHEIILQMQELISARIPDVTVKVSNGGFDKLLGYVSGGGGYGLTFVSEDMTALYQEASAFSEYLRTDPDVVTVEMDTSFDAESLVIDMVHDYMSALGVSSYEAGVTAAVLFQGMDAGQFRNPDDGSRYTIRLYSDLTGDTVTLDDIADISVVSAAGVPVSFANIASVYTEQTVSQINHKDRAKKITVSATLVSEDTAGVNRRAQEWLQKNPLPAGVTTEAGGIIELIGDSLPSIFSALAVAWFLVYTVMVLQFERFRQPFIVMATIPFCLIGVILGLLMFGSTMSLVALLGVISLGGVVVNNGIILIDYINLLRSGGGDGAAAGNGSGTVSGSLESETSGQASQSCETESRLRECVVNGATSRLRPIFMTTLTTMLGVVPMAVARGEGAEIYAPLGQAIAGGLLTSTLITLFIIPVLYFISERRKLRKMNRKKTVAGLLVLMLAAAALAESPAAVTGTEPSAPVVQEISDAAAADTDSAADAVPENSPGPQPLPGSVTGGAYTYDMLYQMVLENNAEILLARENYTQALLDVKDAKASYQPVIGATVGASYTLNPLIDKIEVTAGQLGTISALPPGMSPVLLPPEDLLVFDGIPHFGYAFSLSLQQPVFTWGKITHGVRATEAAAEARRLQVALLEKQQASALEVQLCVLRYLEQIEQLLGQQTEYSNRLVALSEDAERNGVLVQQDVLEAKIQAALIPVTLEEIRQQKESTLQVVQRMTGMNNLQPEQIAFIPPEQKYLDLAAVDQSELEAAALDPSRETFAILDNVIAAADNARKVAVDSLYWKPDIALQISAGFSGDLEKLLKGTASVSSDLNADISIGLKTTLWDGGKKLNDIRRRESELRSASVNRDDTVLAVTQEMRQQCRAMSTAVLKIQYQELKITAAESDIVRQEQMLQTGYGSERDVLQARITEATEKINLIQEKINLAVAAGTVYALTR